MQCAKPRQAQSMTIDVQVAPFSPKAGAPQLKTDMTATPARMTTPEMKNEIIGSVPRTSYMHENDDAMATIVRVIGGFFLLKFTSFHLKVTNIDLGRSFFF